MFKPLLKSFLATLVTGQSQRDLDREFTRPRKCVCISVRSLVNCDSSFMRATLDFLNSSTSVCNDLFSEINCEHFECVSRQSRYIRQRDRRLSLSSRSTVSNRRFCTASCSFWSRNRTTFALCSRKERMTRRRRRISLCCR